MIPRLLLLPLLLFPPLSTAHLVCYSCYGETVNSSCYQNARGAPRIDCEPGECQVWSLHSSDSPADVYMFERTCSGVCQPGCVEISDMGHRFTSCSTCCSSDLCNVGSAAATAERCSFRRIVWSLLPFIMTARR